MGWFDGNKNKEEFKVGDRVRVKYREEEGWIIDKEGNHYMVSLKGGDYVETYDAEDLEKCG